MAARWPNAGGTAALDAGAQQAREHRRDPARGDGDGQRRTVDHGGHDEAAQIRPIDHVDRDAGGAGGGGGVHRLARKLKAVIKDAHLITPTGKFNVYNTQHDIY